MEERSPIDEYMVDCMSADCPWTGLSTACYAGWHSDDYTLFCPECATECEPTEE